LYYVLTEFAKVMAPFLPFLTEAIYRNLTGGRKGPWESVHLQPYPTARDDLIDRELDTKMQLVRQSVAMGRALRSRYTIKNRQPLSELTLVIKNPELRELLAGMAQLIAEELNVKDVVFSADEHDVVTVSAKPNYKRLGKVYGPKMRDAAAVIGGFDAARIDALERGETVDVLGHEVGFDDIEVRRTKREGVEVETQGEITAALNTEVTPELRLEGMAREFVNRIQSIRKQRDLNVTDRILISCSCPAELQDAVRAHDEYIRSETLAVELVCDGPGAHGEQIEVNGIEARVTVERAGAQS
ncbi:MAG: class I tRNA ligase family protein, partial [Chitinivibrionales bacterium]|nr:class I tRNA ligase family protein [Chitinivibrionales bacterium]